MSNKENRCIAYIYNEMDPSERLEFERDLKTDENLLIEVESLKKVSGNLKNPQLICPPHHVVEQIHQQANQKLNSKERINTSAVWLVAASVLVIVAFSTITMIDPGTDQQQSSENVAGNSDWTLPESESYEPRRVTTKSSDLPSPWVDRNDILHFNDRFNSDNVAQVDSIMNTSFDKLTPVTVPSKISSMRQQLHLTGSN